MPDEFSFPHPTDAVPNSENCRARQLGAFDYELVSCVSEHPICSFMLRFGNGRLCRHPQRQEIVERTQRKNAPPPGEEHP
jgi:hypothetical protein